MRGVGWFDACAFVLCVSWFFQASRGNTGQVVAELKVVTSNKLWNETDEASSSPKQDMYVFCKAEQGLARTMYM